MSYPKVPPKPSVGTATRLTDQRKERLLKLQERQELKGLLINKFKKLYGNKAAFIDKEVENFMKQETLTEANLKKLDERIRKKTEVEEAKAASKAPSVARSKQSAASVKSKASAISNQSKAPSQVSGSQRSDSMSSYSKGTSTYIPEDDDQEWAAILEYDTLMFREQERARLKREQENKVKIRRELDRQMKEREQKKLMDDDDDRLYQEAQRANLDMMERRELERDQEYLEKIMQEKLLRDKQLQEEKRRKREEDRQQKAIDQRLVQRLKEELQLEQDNIEERRREERAYMQRMMEENEQNKRRMMELREQERRNDVQSMEDYARMLDRQEQDRINQMKARQERQQQLMAKMADTVLKEQHQRNLQQDLLLLRQIEEKEDLDRQEDQRRLMRQKEQKQEIKEFLDQQVRDQKARKIADKASYDQQAVMWKRDADDFFAMEEERKTRQKELNKLHQQTLLLQIEEKQMKKQRRMNPAEAKINKELIKRARDAPENQQGQQLQGFY